MRHKHADLIHAWAEGAQIQIESKNGWRDDYYPLWIPSNNYRIKPEPKPKPDIVRYFFLHPESSFASPEILFNSNIKVIFDGESLKTKSAEAIK